MVPLSVRNTERLPAPSFSLTDLNGQARNLDSFNQKIKVVNFCRHGITTVLWRYRVFRQSTRTTRTGP